MRKRKRTKRQKMMMGSNWQSQIADSYANSTKKAGKALVQEEVRDECIHCYKDSCVWVTKKEEMRYFDENKDTYLPEEDLPPNSKQHLP
jgi:hydroxylamine reductase (hybrid-cluster protein)